MALRGSCPTLLLALVLLGAWLALASGQRPKGTYDMFVRKHWDNPKMPVNSSMGGVGGRPPASSAYCDLQTRARGIQGSNIFIHERLAVISSLCKKGGRPLPRGRRISKKPLSLTRCRAAPGGGGYMEKSASRRISKKPLKLTRCRAAPGGGGYMEKSMSRRIVVVCRNKRPVRLLRVVSPSSWL